MNNKIYKSKKLLLSALTALMFMLTGGFLQAQVVWTKLDVPGKEANQAEAHLTRMSTNFLKLSQYTRLAPEESNPASEGLAINIPDQRGSETIFYLKRTRLVNDIPGTKMPDVQTFTGYTRDRKSAIYLTIYSGHIYASVSASGHNWYLSTPDGSSNADFVAVFDEQGRANQFEKPVRNAVDYIDELKSSIIDSIRTSNRGTLNASKQCSLKVFRLAITTTAEYTNANGGRSATIANLTAFVNAMNAIYEKEVGIRLTLVTNNALLYTDTAACPVQNNGATCGQLDSVKSIFDNNIASNLYDVGMCICYNNFGGCASVAAACRGSKGRSISGYNSTNVTSYLREVTCHEIAHQLSAGHTHNADCSGTGSLTSDWEPGGGSTIMAYGCIPNYTDFNTGIYFHAGSIGQMTTYITTGNGNCYTVAATGNSPAITTPSLDTFFIPTSTPYRLYAKATDPEDATLWYTFDQVDLGPLSPLPPSSTRATGPMVRSFEPSTKSIRYVPNLDSLRTGIIPTFESLPSIERSLTFWATVFDYNPSCGCHSVDTFLIKTKGTQAFSVTSFGAPTTLSPGTVQTVNWNVAGTDVPPYNAAFVKILFASDGVNYNVVLRDSVPNNGSATITIPNTSTINGRIMVASLGNIFFNINAGDIRIEPACSTAQYSTIWPDEPVTATQNSTALLLSMYPTFGLATDTIASEFTTATPTGVTAFAPAAGDTLNCQVGNGFSGRVDQLKFAIGKPGRYTISRTLHTMTGNLYISLHNSNGLTPTAAAACNNYLFRSNVYATATGVSITGSFNFPATGDSTYTVSVLKTGTTTLGTYRLNIAGPAKVYTEYYNPASMYGYLATDSNDIIVVASNQSPDLRSRQPGSYKVYGVSHSPSITLSDYLNQPMNNFRFGTFPASGCALLSTNFTEVTINGNPSPLPVDYLKLDVIKEKEAARLNWSAPLNGISKTASFEIESSADAQAFFTLANGSVGSFLLDETFTYLHEKPLTGTNYYRVKQLLADGHFQYSNLQKLYFGPHQQISIAPNPVTGMLTITTSGYDYPLQLKLSDVSGRLLRNIIVNTPKAGIDLSQLPLGFYLLTGDGFTEKLIKQ